MLYKWVRAARQHRSIFLINLAAIVERADESILPAVYLFMGRSLNATPSQLGTVTFCRAVVQTLSSPISGFMGDRVDRTRVVGLGCLIWGVMTSAIGFSTSLTQACGFAAVNGLGLALLIPCAQSLIADCSPVGNRGKAFGAMALTGSVGALAGSVFATNVGSHRVMGLEGWRFAFHVVAAISLMTGWLVVRFADDRMIANRGRVARVAEWAERGVHKHSIEGSSTARPNSGEVVSHRSLKLSMSGPDDTPLHCVVDEGVSGDKSSITRQLLPSSRWVCLWSSMHDAGAQIRGAWRDLKHILGIRTFQMIIAQGVVGSIPWQAVGFFTLWLQLLGFMDWQASLVMATFSTTCALGTMTGGLMGDFVARHRPRSGRIAIAQLSVAAGLPLTFLLLKVLPYTHEAGHPGLGPYLVTVGLLGLVCSWTWAGCNSPMFAEIVPNRMRSSVYAFDRCFEGSIAAMTAPVVGLLAEHVYGFKSGPLGGAAEMEETWGNGTTVRGHSSAVGEPQGDVFFQVRNAQALGDSLAVCTLVPWVLCLIFYTPLYWCYPRDKAAAQQ